jgi:hypothetical protein
MEQTPKKQTLLLLRMREFNRTGKITSITKSNSDCEKKYNITPTERDALFISQGRMCACCAADDPGNMFGWHTDHDHRTGKVRGILCHSCNVKLGKLEKRRDFRMLFSYLMRSRLKPSGAKEE